MEATMLMGMNAGAPTGMERMLIVKIFQIAGIQLLVAISLDFTRIKNINYIFSSKVEV